MLDELWGEAGEVALEETRIEDDPVSLQVDQVPRESGRRNSLDLASGTEAKLDTSRPGIRHGYTRVLAEQLTGELHQPKLAILEGDHPVLGGEGRENHEGAAVLEDVARVLLVCRERVLARDRDRLIADAGWRGDRRRYSA